MIEEETEYKKLVVICWIMLVAADDVVVEMISSREPLPPLLPPINNADSGSRFLEVVKEEVEEMLLPLV